MAFDTSRVSPTDAFVTLRSLRRRFAEAFDQVATAEAPTEVPGGAGMSPVDHAAATVTALTAIGAALHQVLVIDDPEVALPSATTDGPALRGTDPAIALAKLGDVARAVADAMADVHGDAWTRSGRGPNGPISALEIARLGVAISIDHLRAAERLINR